VSGKARTTSDVIDEIKRMIYTGQLLPGQQLRQESMAEMLGVSRLPIREALRQLSADGLVRHTPNAGFTVTRLSRSEFDQIYRMRHVLESDLIADLPRPSRSQVDEIARLCEVVSECANRQDLAAMQSANHAFHFAIFRLSDLTLVIDEIERLWTLAAPYHAAYLSSPDNRRAILKEHDLMVSALRKGDTARLSELMRQHRQGSESQLAPALSPGVAPVP
jgi:DNA-binding GntR family transcriptional regulator